MNYALFVTGCQQNEYDAGRLEFILDQSGLTRSPENQADIIFVLACSVRQKAVDRIFGKLRAWIRLPKKPKIIITGCILPEDKKKLRSRVNTIAGIDQLFQKLPELIGKRKTKNLAKFADYRGYITITVGCNNFCTYCAVPFTRGRESSRPETEIVAEAKRVARLGVKNILLLGQNVNSYNNFAGLLKKLGKIPGIEQINFLSSNPQNFGADLIGWLKTSPKAPQELHLPLQSGSDQILKKMNRRYTVLQYLTLISKIRDAKPKIKITTDIIVGFPSETLSDFKKTVELVKKLKFAKAYVSQYSPRPGTAAARLLANDVPPAEKKRRWQIIDRLINK